MNNTIFRAFIVAFLSLQALAFSQSANAFAWRTYMGTPIKWTMHTTPMFLSSTSFPPGNVYTDTLLRAMGSWNDAGSNFRFGADVDSDGTQYFRNNLNEVFFCTACMDPGAIATAWTYSEGFGYVEADIGFDSSRRWTHVTSDGANLFDEVYEFEGVAIHELGHALGLLHEDRWLASMNSYTPNGGYTGDLGLWTPLGDDRQGARALYSVSEAQTDIAPLSVRDGGTDINGKRLALRQEVAPERLERGRFLNASYVFSNLGTAPATFGICWYLTNGPSGTVLIDSHTVASAAPGDTGSYVRMLYVPIQIEPGYYRVMYRVDCFNENVERYEGANNDFTIPNWVYIYAAKPFPTRIENDATFITYGPDAWSWSSGTDPNASGGTYTVAENAGAELSFSFSGTGIQWLSILDGCSGQARVTLDGVTTIVDNYRDPAQGWQQVAWEATGLAYTTHTLRIEVLGTANPASCGRWIYVDAFNILP